MMSEDVERRLKKSLSTAYGNTHSKTCENDVNDELPLQMSNVLRNQRGNFLSWAENLVRWYVRYVYARIETL